MSKNGGKKPKSPRKPNSSAHPPVSPPKPPGAATSDEQEGQDKKAQLIKEGERKQAELIAEGNSEKEKIIKKAQEEARKEAADERKKIINDYIQGVKEKAEEEAKQERAKIISDSIVYKLEADERQKKVNEDSKILEEKSKLLEKQNVEYLENYTKLQSEKQSYKNDILLKFQKDMEELQKEIKNLEEEKKQVELKNNQLERNISFSNADKDTLESKLSNYNELHSENTKLKANISLMESENRTLQDIRQDLEKNIDDKNNALLRFGDDPKKLLIENENLKEELKKINDRLAECPEIAELEMLRDRNRQYSQIQQQIDTLRMEKSQLEKQLIDAKIYQADLDNKDKFIRVLELQCSELQTELNRITDRYNKNTTKVFAGLSKIDEEQSHASYSNSNVSLNELCTNFKNWLASQKKLFYTDAHIRTFMAGFAASRLIILEGMSGTGKSSLPRKFGEYIGAVTTRIPVQSSWKDRNDLLGFYNDFEKRYKETDFLKAVYRAVKDKDNIHCILLDEMNLSRIEYYFADILSVLEDPNPENWKISLVSDAASIKGDMPVYIHDGELLLTENIWFAGTANKDDSTFTITDKVYDRAIVLDFKERASEPSGLNQSASNRNLNYGEFQQLLKDAVNTSSTEKDKISGLVEELDLMMQTHFEISFGNRISSQIEKFVPAYKKCGGETIEAFDILFSTKVLRKIQGYDESTKKGLADILDELNNEYPNQTDFHLSKSMIKKLQSRI